MKPPFRLLITETPSRATWERIVDTLPATLGRGAASTVVFAHATISKRHAELVLDGDDLVLVDHASHNGTLVRARTERVERRVRLADVDYAFSLGVFDVRIVPLLSRGATILLTEASARRDATKAYTDAERTEVRIDGAALSAELEPLIERYRNAFGDLFLGISEGVSDLDPDQRVQWLRNFLAQHDDLAHDPMIRDLLASLGATTSPKGGPAPLGSATERAAPSESTAIELPVGGGGSGRGRTA